jgi:DNA replicative helicase MCM subunit Mcm2 (Cdc46/Mcm family)
MLQNYFVAIRQEEIKTIRALESLCRLTEAHAKLMLRSQTTIFDCVSVIMLMNGVYTSDRKKYECYLEQMEGYM